MKILVIDDEFVALARIKAFLKKIGDCDTSTNPKEALMQYRDAIEKGEPYNLVTIDIDMPQLDGFEVLKIMEQIERRLGVNPAKKLMVSAGGTVDNVLAAKDMRCEGFIVKPIDKKSLFDKIRDMGFIISE
jgi:two-component system chemotaxis response regulator CheY